MDRSEASSRPRAELVASTGDIAAARGATASAIPTGSGSGNGNGDADVRGYFESAQWTADGTAIVTYSSSNLISGYVVPEDLLAPKPAPLDLTPQAAIQLPEPSNVLAAAPYFSLAEPYTNQVLASARDHPIQLFYLTPASSSSTPAASYPFTKARSETYLSATSLVWPGPGSHFIAGSRNLLAKFDVSRPGASSEPVVRVKTIPSERHLLKGGGVGMRGTVSALGAQPVDSSYAGLVAAGTWTRWVGLYDFAGGAGECVATWSVASAAASTTTTTTTTTTTSGSEEGGKGHGGGGGVGIGIGGAGITQTIWSPCGRYLLIAERRSRGILVYDVRVTGQLLCHLAGRDATDSNQRIACDVFPSSSSDGEGGFEVWSGTAAAGGSRGGDGGGGRGGGGMVKVWEGVGTREGAHEPSWSWRAHDDAVTTVGAACVHPSGSVVATCAGSWVFPDDEEGIGGDNDDGSSSPSETAWMRRRNRESSLKIWSIDSQGNDDMSGQTPGGQDQGIDRL